MAIRRFVAAAPGPNAEYKADHFAFREAAGARDPVVNDVGMLAGIVAGMGFTTPEMAALARLSTCPGPIAHVLMDLRPGVPTRSIPDQNVASDRRCRDPGPDLAAAGWPRSRCKALIARQFSASDPKREGVSPCQGLPESGSLADGRRSRRQQAVEASLSSPASR